MCRLSKMHAPFHTMLTEKSKEYCGILPYFGSLIYWYEVLLMGIACVPQIWIDYITLILGELQHKVQYIAIMDDLLIHSMKTEPVVVDRATFTVNDKEQTQA